MSEQPDKEAKDFLDVLKGLLNIKADQEPITCDECYEQIDRYVDMLRAGQKPETVLPHIKTHLDECLCCREELQALIGILEKGDGSPL